MSEKPLPGMTGWQFLAVFSGSAAVLLLIAGAVVWWMLRDE